MLFRKSKTTPPLAKFAEFVKYSRFFFNCLGYQPYTLHDIEQSKNYIRLLRGALFNATLCSLMLALSLELIWTMNAFVNDQFVDAVMSLSYAGFCAIGLMKLSYIWYKRAQLKIFMDRLQVIFPRTAAEQEQLQLSRYLRQCIFVTRGFSILYMVLIWTYNLYALLEYYVFNKWLHVRDVEQGFPYNFYIPWDWHGHWSFYPIYVLQVSTAYASAAAQSSSDLLLCAMATQMVMHYDHVARSIEAYCVQLGRVRALEEGGNLRSTDGGWQLARSAYYKSRAIESDMEYLCGIIAYHADLLRLSELMNDIFGVPLLVNFLASAFIICFVGFEMTIGVPPDILFKLSLFLVCAMVQVYLICYHGQLLIDASTNVAQSVFHHDWTQADVRYQKMLVLIAKRAQTPAWLKATLFLNVSRDTMTIIMQVSYKFFALIRTMYTD